MGSQVMLHRRAGQRGGAMLARVRSTVALFVLAAVLVSAVSCDSGDGGWKAEESVVFTLTAPDTVVVGMPVEVHITGTARTGSA